jgi:DNA polymerase III alpha subunit
MYQILLKNELEVIGFYFSNHPISFYPAIYFKQKNILDWEEIYSNKEIKNANIVGSVLDIKERSNKDGKKYAFLTISTLQSQIELSIFSDKLNEYRHLIKEGNVLLFNIDITREIENENLRLIVRKIEDFDKTFSNQKKIISIFVQPDFDLKFVKSLFIGDINNNNDDELYLYMNKDGKLVSLNFSKKYTIKSYKYLDKLTESKKVDYSIELS